MLCAWCLVHGFVFCEEWFWLFQRACLLILPLNLVLSQPVNHCEMRVVIDPDSGFCFGVNRAIQTAENELKAGNTVYCLGEMVHNQVQMDQLKSKGLWIITHADLYNLKGETVMIRAHGEPPETFRLAEELGIKLINATCPIVSKLQEKIFNVYSSDTQANVQVVIFGKPGHAEVTGLNGNAGNKAIVVSSVDDFLKINLNLRSLL